MGFADKPNFLLQRPAPIIYMLSAAAPLKVIFKKYFLFCFHRDSFFDSLFIPGNSVTAKDKKSISNY
jgi:hypothetical protein